MSCPRCSLERAYRAIEAKKERMAAAQAQTENKKKEEPRKTPAPKGEQKED